MRDAGGDGLSSWNLPARDEPVQRRGGFAAVEETTRYRTAVLQNPFLIVRAEHFTRARTHTPRGEVFTSSLSTTHLNDFDLASTTSTGTVCGLSKLLPKTARAYFIDDRKISLQWPTSGNWPDSYIHVRVWWGRSRRRRISLLVTVEH